ncbi:hypothetical protein A8B75_01220 [Sphingomonadales bacterium EhC05]|nr:hypothetical protein A8B75_01220 [Sphingomonadales bacterium EhC05]
MAIGRPKSIVWFEWLFWISFVVSYVGDYVVEGSVLEFIIADLLTFGIAALFWYMITRQSNDVFKWIYTVGAIVGLGIFGLALTANVIKLDFLDNELLGMSASEIVFGIVVNSLNIAAAICLYLQPSREWFEAQGAVFDWDDKPPGVVK